MRNVEINLTEGFENIVGGVGHNEVVAAAIGYLSLWAINSERYCSVSIWGDDKGWLNAIYKDKGGAVTYSIGGVPHFKEDNDKYDAITMELKDKLLTLERYSFHS